MNSFDLFIIGVINTNVSGDIGTRTLLYFLWVCCNIYLFSLAKILSNQNGSHCK